MNHLHPTPRIGRLGRPTLLSATLATLVLIAPHPAQAGQQAESPTATLSEACTAPAWDAHKDYLAGNVVKQGDAEYTARFWSLGVDPATHHGDFDPWSLTRTCTAVEPCEQWRAEVRYKKRALVIQGGKGYQAVERSVGQDPATHNGPNGSGEPWKKTQKCSFSPQTSPASF